jgi:hypothetical protein
VQGPGLIGVSVSTRTAPPPTWASLRRLKLRHSKGSRVVHTFTWQLLPNPNRGVPILITRNATTAAEAVTYDLEQWPGKSEVAAPTPMLTQLTCRLGIRSEAVVRMGLYHPHSFRPGLIYAVPLAVMKTAVYGGCAATDTRLGRPSTRSQNPNEAEPRKGLAPSTRNHSKVIRIGAGRTAELRITFRR